MVSFVGGACLTIQYANTKKGKKQRLGSDHLRATISYRM